MRCEHGCHTTDRGPRSKDDIRGMTLCEVSLGRVDRPPSDVGRTSRLAVRARQPNSIILIVTSKAGTTESGGIRLQKPNTKKAARPEVWLCARIKMWARRSYWPIELATEENTLLELLPINRMVPTTSTRITASITAYSAMSCPSSSDHSLRNVLVFIPAPF